MRENPPFEVRLDRFGAGRAAVAIGAFLAIAAPSGWAWSTAAAGDDITRVFAAAALLTMATLAAALPRGVVARGRHSSRSVLCSSSRWAVASAQTAPPAE